VITIEPKRRKSKATFWRRCEIGLSGCTKVSDYKIRVESTNKVFKPKQRFIIACARCTKEVEKCGIARVTIELDLNELRTSTN